jgi:hypothetical protein
MTSRHGSWLQPYRAPYQLVDKAHLSQAFQGIYTFINSELHDL